MPTKPLNGKSETINILNSILNAIDAFICVTVPETGELLYLNDRIIKNFGLSDDYAGRLCFKLLKNLEERCDICPYFQLEKEPDKIVHWEQFEPLVNRTFRKIGMYIDWPGGGKGHIEYGIDITDILQTQRELERRIAMTDALERSVIEAEERLELILNSSPMCCRLWDRDMNLIDCNEAAVKLFGAPSKREYLANFRLFAPEYQPDGERSREKASRYFNQAVSEGAAVFEWTARLHDNTPMPAKVILARVKYQDDYIVAAYTIDMREHKRLVDELETALLKAREADRAKAEFMSRISHEMLTPMNAIMGMAQLIKLQYKEEELKDYAEIIETASQDLMRMIKNVLDMSSLEFAAFKLEPAAFSFSRMFDDVHESLERYIKKKQQIFSVSFDPAIPPRLLGDEKQIAQVISNLLKNAVKFTPEHGELGFKAEILDRDSENVVLRLEIKDNGIGMSKEQQDKLFDLFEQADGTLSRPYEGLGLGLAYSKRIIELMGGRIWVDSEPGQGSRFTFTCKFKILQPETTA